MLSLFFSSIARKSHSVLLAPKGNSIVPSKQDTYTFIYNIPPQAVHLSDAFRDFNTTQITSKLASSHTKASRHLFAPCLFCSSASSVLERILFFC